MLAPKLQMLEKTLKRLMRRGASGPLERVVAKTHAADLGDLLIDFSPGERLELIQRCADDDKRAEVLSGAEQEVAAQLIADLPRQRAAELLHRVAPDDLADILETLPAEVAEEILRLMRRSERQEIEDLARYESATAGGIMSPRFFALHRDTSVGEAISRLHEVDTEVEMVFYVYVVNEVGQLLGVLSLRQLVTNKPGAKLIDLMTSDVISVTPEVDQEEVAKLASRYGLLAIPVVDSANKLLGIVTVDDVIDVLQEEATEDILRMAGAGDELGEQRVLRAVLFRFPWVMATAIGGALSALLLVVYVETLTQYLPLVFSLPLVLGLTGVTGLQSAVTITQRIAQGRIGARLVLPMLRQAVIGALLGIVLGSLVAAFARAWWGPVPSSLASLVIAAGIAAAMAGSAALGSLLPALFARLHLDPTLASGPFGIMAADLLGLLLYLVTASHLLPG